MPHDHSPSHDHRHDHAHDHGHAHAHGDHGHGHHHGPGHVHSHGAHASESALFWALLLTGGFMIAEVTGGLLADSLALLADAAHMLTDAASLAMAFFAVRAARRPATPAMSYGHHRWQVLAAFVNGLALLVLSAWIVVEAVLRLWQPEAVAGGMVMLIATIGLIVNIAAFAILSGGEQNLNVRGALAHVLGDLLGSVAALVAGALIWWRGWMIADPLLSAFVALLMLRTGWAIARQSAHVLLEGTPPGLDEQAIVSAIEDNIGAVDSVHHVHAWSLSDDKPIVTLHATLRSDVERDATLVAIHELLHQRFGVEHSTIQIEDCPCATPVQGCAA
ncbi:cation diffusion facilitator family transporter [Solimonas marina]|uniref:Cation transporter n=1 Tax=Solimonas marina TaxID=2714601 RepID=A0A969WGJ7_9GAMM|nr:cation diffusion facilitator family transporter [Solimonas marina]NKF24285.1 cation transporter [Solimonas marina]